MVVDWSGLSGWVAMKPLPDRMSAYPGPYFHKDHAPVRISIDGTEYTGRVVEFCRSKGWARILDLDEHGDPKPGAAGGTARIKWKHGRIVVWLASDPAPANALTTMVAQ